MKLCIHICKHALWCKLKSPITPNERENFLYFLFENFPWFLLFSLYENFLDINSLKHWITWNIWILDKSSDETFIVIASSFLLETHFLPVGKKLWCFLLTFKSYQIPFLQKIKNNSRFIFPFWRKLWDSNRAISNNWRRFCILEEVMSYVYKHSKIRFFRILYHSKISFLYPILILYLDWTITSK